MVTTIPEPNVTDGDSSVLSFKDVAVRIAGRTIWSHVTVNAGPGQFVAILGPNGAGKSTFVKVALGLVGHESGDIRVLGMSPGHAHRAIGYLPQRRSFESQLRVRGIDIVRLGLDGDRWGSPLPFIDRLSASRRRDRDRIDEVIELVGATEFAKRPIGQVSGGEQQRLLIAQALIRRPRLLFLDEPLDSLDLPNQASIAALISSLSQSEKMTVVMVAHDVNPILGYVDQVAYFASGGVVAGRPKDVINTETLSRLFETSIEVLTASDGRLVVVGEPHAPSIHSDRHQHVHETP